MSQTKVLIVEDEVLVGEGLRVELEQMDYEVCGTALTGREAVRLAKKHRPDVILMDIRLDGEEMDGIDAAEVIYKELQIPVIYLTAYSDDETLGRAKDTYSYGYILKPYVKEEVRSNIEVALQHAREEHHVRQDKDKLDDVVDTIRECVLVTDTHNKIVMMNRAAEELTQWKFSKAVGKPIDTVLVIRDESSDDIPEFPGYAVLETRKTFTNLSGLILKRKRGQAVPVAMVISPMQDNGGDPMGTIVMIQDLTKVHQKEQLWNEQLERAMQNNNRLGDAFEKALISARDARQADQLKGEFLLGLDRYVREPLERMIRLGMGINTTTLSEEDQGTIRQMIDVGRSLSHLFRDVTELTRLEQGRYESTTIDFSLREMLDVLYRDMSNISALTDTSLTIETTMPLPSTIHTDPVLLSRCLKNLLTFVMYHSRANTIALKIGRVKAPPVGALLSFELIDRGEALSRAEFDRLRDHVSTLHPSHSSWGQTGLELAVADKMAELLGGHLTLSHSKGPGGGNVFVLAVFSRKSPESCAMLSPSTIA